MFGAMIRFLPLLGLLALAACSANDTPAPGPRTAQWQTITLDFRGPQTSERDSVNPFTERQLTVTFTNGDERMVIPGFYAADGRAADSGADSGNVWQVRFRPPSPGEWTYSASFGGGAAGAEIEQPSGSLTVGPPRPGETGRLLRDHPRYLRWAETGEYFLKAGADSPENLLGYYEFDGTYRHSNEFRANESKTEGLHRFATHADDFAGGPTWGGGRGRNLLGAISYLAGRGINSIYFLTNNIGGDGKDVWPYVDHETFDRFDVSKLDQWERVFNHADSLGMMLHFVLQETENETMLDGGNTGPLRQLYFRELVARFGHHRAVTWNLGEENGPNDWSETWQDNAQQEAMIAWFAANDPYGGYVVLHTHPGAEAFAAIYEPLLGNADLDGLALQIGAPYTAYDVTRKWLTLSDSAGAPWVLTLDEVGPWFRGLDPDAGYTPHPTSNNQDSLRALTLWANLLAGGAGVEWYFGAHNANNDLSAEDWRSRDRAWGWTAAAVRFFRQRIPFWDMDAAADRVTGEAMCFGRRGGPYLVYLPFGKPTTFTAGELAEAGFRFTAYDPSTGAAGGAHGEAPAGSAPTLELSGQAPADRAYLIEPMR